MMSISSVPPMMKSMRRPRRSSNNVSLSTPPRRPTSPSMFSRSFSPTSLPSFHKLISISTFHRTIAKSLVTLDIKPWDDETDMAALEAAVRSVEKPGLIWGLSKLVPIGYGIKKLQMTVVVEDELISLDELQEEIAEFEDYIQVNKLTLSSFPFVPSLTLPLSLYRSTVLRCRCHGQDLNTHLPLHLFSLSRV